MAIKTHKGSPYWYAKFYVNGKAYEKSTRVRHEGRERNKKEARAAEARIHKEALDAAKRTKVLGHTIRDGELYDLKRARGKCVAKVTIECSLLKAWALLKAYFGESYELHKIKPDDIHEYMTWRQNNRTTEAELAGQTLYRETSALKRAMVYYEISTKGWPDIGKTPVHTTKKGKERSKEELERLFAVMPPEYKDVFTVGLLTALRAEELARIERSWIKNDYLHLPASATKKRKARMVHLTPPAMQALERAFAARGDKPWGPVGGPNSITYIKRCSGYVNRLCAKLKIKPNIHLRDMRHTFATWTLQKGGDLKAVMEALGHSDLAAAARYQSAHPARVARMASIMTSECTVFLP